MGNIFNYSGPVTHKTPKALISVTMNPNKPHSICIILFPVYWNIWIQASIPYFFHSFQRCALHCSIVKANLFFLLKKKRKKKGRKKELNCVLFSQVRPHTSVLLEWIIYCFQLRKWERFCWFCRRKIYRALRKIETFVAMCIGKIRKNEMKKLSIITSTC